MPSNEHPTSEQVLTNQFGDNYLYSINGESFAHLSAAQVYQSGYSEHLFQDDTYYVIAGTDSGLLIEYIVNNGVPRNTHYLFIELPQYIAMIKPDLNEEWQDVLKFCTPQEWANEYDQDNAASYYYNNRVSIIYSMAIMQISNNDYHKLRLSVDQTLTNRKYENNAGLGNRDFINLQLQNVSHNLNSVKCMDNVFDGKTCIILGGGPSLDEHLDWVRDNQDRLVIIAVSRISKKLQEYGLTPHIVCAIDPQQVSHDFSKDMFNFPPEVLMLNSYHVNFKILSQWSGKCVFYGDRLPWKSELNAEEHFHEGPTVVNAALIAAVNMGCKKVLLTGTDLCYASDGKTHASGSFEADREIELSRESQWHENYAGEKVETIIPLILTGKYLSKHALYANEKGCSVINLSSSALSIEHIDHKPAKDIVLPSFDSSPTDTINKHVPNYSIHEMNHSFKELTKEFDRVNHDLIEVNKLANEAIEATHKAYSLRSSAKQQAKNRLKIEKNEKKLANKYQYLNTLIKTLAIREFTKILIGGSAGQLDDNALEKRNVIYYQSYICGVELLRELLSPAQERLNIFKNSYSNGPNIRKLCHYWAEKHEFGCSQLFKKRMPDIVEYLNVDDIESLDKLSEYRNTYYRNIDYMYGKLQFTLDGVAQKIRLQFVNKDLVGLTKIVEFLNESKKEKIAVQSHKFLANGYINLLKDEPEKALTNLLQVTSDILIQQDIDQKISLMILLEKFDQVENTLANMCEKPSPQMRLYGQILAHNKKNNLAIDVYSRYLEVFNSDLSAWCELAELFVQCNVIESAKMAYEFVLSIEPTHEQATSSLEKVNQHLAAQSS